MDPERFRDWFSRVDEWPAAQRQEVAAVLPDPPGGGLAGRDRAGLGWGAALAGRCRGARPAVCGASGRKGCGKASGALTGTALSGLHRKELWLALGASLAAGETIKASAERCGIGPSTAPRRHHRLPAAALGIPRESSNAAAGERVRDAPPSQTASSRRSRIKGFLRGFRGIAAKGLDRSLRWFHLLGLGTQPAPRACLVAAMTRPCLRLAD